MIYLVVVTSTMALTVNSSEYLNIDVKEVYAELKFITFFSASAAALVHKGVCVCVCACLLVHAFFHPLVFI